MLDLRADDQDRTHRMLRDGEVIGCISSRERTIQGCRLHHLGAMDYRVVASPAFAGRHFPEGLNRHAVCRAPALVFNRRDELLDKMLYRAIGEVPAKIPTNYLPSSEKFADFISGGYAYGMLPDQQCAERIADGDLIDLAPGHRLRVDLHWHCWNLNSKLLEKLTRQLVDGARLLLAGNRRVLTVKEKADHVSEKEKLEHPR